MAKKALGKFVKVPKIKQPLQELTAEKDYQDICDKN